MNKIFILTLSLFICFCTFGKKEFINFKRNNTNYRSNLKLDGFYYSESKGLISKNHIHPIFLYEDGTAYLGGNFGPQYEDLSNEQDIIKSCVENIVDFYSTPRHPKSKWLNAWGIYRIVGDTLYIKYFTGETSGHVVLYETANIVLNDTTFVQFRDTLLKKMPTKKNYENTEERIYKYYPHPFKPDPKYDWTKELK